MGIGKHGDDNVAKGVGKQVEGKVNEVVGAAKGNLRQELGGKLEKNVGKVQEKLGHSEQKAAR
ncbi:MAG TPA: CsbD family protein [Thermoanaerobaculia bacterium]|nr:CsbD family protein [Thermoanaerobaculia bacterium]